jgi:hypothetical protein
MITIKKIPSQEFAAEDELNYIIMRNIKTEM